MPLVHIYLQEGKDAKYLTAVGDAFHEAMIETWGIAAKDRFQIYHQKSKEEMQIDRHMWGMERSDDMIVFHIFTSPRSKVMKLGLYRRLPEILKAKVGLRSDDVFVTLFDNTREDWSFGNGRAQLMESKLPARGSAAGLGFEDFYDPLGLNFLNRVPAHGQKRPRDEELPESWDVTLNYGEVPPAGKRNGRYVNPEQDKGDCIDTNKGFKTKMHNGRVPLMPFGELLSLDTHGFVLENWPTVIHNFQDNAEIQHVYYEEMRALIKRVSGADRVLIFDHTVRRSDAANLGAPVHRVHCDYTEESAPRRLEQFAKAGVYSQLSKKSLSESDIKAVQSRRFAFINVWRSVTDDPVERNSRACCDQRSVQSADRHKYELVFPDRVGENYSLKPNAAHKWYYFPRMVKDECLVVKEFDKGDDLGDHFTFHTAFDDPLTTEASPARHSIEIRALAFFDGGHCITSETVDDSCITSEEAQRCVNDTNDAPL